MGLGSRLGAERGWESRFEFGKGYHFPAWRGLPRCWGSRMPAGKGSVRGLESHLVARSCSGSGLVARRGSVRGSGMAQRGCKAPHDR